MWTIVVNRGQMWTSVGKRGQWWTKVDFLLRELWLLVADDDLPSTIRPVATQRSPTGASGRNKLK